MKKEKNNTAITYKGSVTIKEVDIKTGKIKRKLLKHNEGFVPLFEVIARSLAGDSTFIQSVPRFLKCFDAYNVPTVSSFIASNNPIVTKTNESASVTFDFLIPFTQLSTTSETTKLRLYSSTVDGVVYAEVILTTPFTGSGETNFLVSWKMTIGNK